MPKLYGIKNCDTVKKARAWLGERRIDVRFHDFKTDGITAAHLERWANTIGWETLLNRKGTTWRALPDGEKARITDAASATRLMLEKPAVIKRPLLELGDAVHVGFSPEAYNALFASV